MRAERQAEKDEDEGDVKRVERQYGVFIRRFKVRAPSAHLCSGHSRLPILEFRQQAAEQPCSTKRTPAPDLLDAQD